MVNNKIREDINYIVYAYNTLNPQEIVFNLPDGTLEDVQTVLKEDFNVKM